MKNPHLGSQFAQSHKDSFVHLHLHTQYSLLDGALRLDHLFKKAQEFQVPAIASTDHGNMFGAIDFYTRAINAGIKPILGSEIYFTPGSRFDRRPPKNTKTLDSQDEMEGKHQIHHLILLCKNQIGYQNLCKLLTIAYSEGFYYKPRADVDLLKQYSEGLIATTACLKGEVGFNFFTNQDDRAVQAALKLREVYKDNFYLEIQENGIPEQKEVNQRIVRLAQEHSIPLVATNDCHYLEREDAAAQEVLMCIQTGKTLEDEKRMKLTTSEFYFKSPQEMRQAFAWIPEACDNTLRIADACNLEIRWHDEKGKQVYHLPKFEIKTQESEAEYFSREAQEGLAQRFAGPHFKKIRQEPHWATDLLPKYQERLETEIKLIQQMGFTGYFLIVSDFIRWAKKEKIPVGPGRGSGAGSLVAYALDITNIDPLPYNLLFERFINPERISLPDFDVDFCQERRQEVINYVTQKYGEERVGQIITFGKLQAKAVLRDVSRVFALPYSEADALAKLVPDELGIELSEAIEKEPKLKELEEKDPKIKRILFIAKKLEGLYRHASIHAAGVIITNDPLVTYCPLYRGREGEQVVQFDKDFSEKIGLVKFDFLGLKTLTVIENASAFIRRDYKADFTIEDIPMDDPAVFAMIGEGDTTGVFQLESSGMKDLCKRIKPDSINDITAINALYRPGPMGSGMHDEFVEIKHRRKPEQYLFEELRPVLSDTYGIIVYQEQVMNIARTIAGYSLGQADMLRRAMGKKKPEEMERHKKIFMEGAQAKGFDAQKSEYLFDLMAKFAEYGFNKSHAVAYAVVAYQTAYLKKYYPACFYAALLGTEMDNMDKVTLYVQDARDHEIEILPPDVNESLWQFNVLNQTIRFGMGAIKNVGQGAVEAIIKERQGSGAFKNFAEFCERVDQKQINSRVLESLIKVGAFDRCEKLPRKTLLENKDAFVSFGAKKQEDKLMGQESLFGGEMLESQAAEDVLQITPGEEFSDEEKLRTEAELLGIYVSGHPLDRFKDVMAKLSSMPIHQVQELPKVAQGSAAPAKDKNEKGGKFSSYSREQNDQFKRSLVLSGLVANLKPIVTKKGDKMVFFDLEDLSGKIEVVVFPKTYAQFQTLIHTQDPLMVSGTVNLAEEPRKLIAEKFSPLKEAANDRVTAVRIHLKLEELHPHSLNKVKNVLLSYRGSVPTQFIFESAEGRARMNLDESFLVAPSPQMAAKINDILSSEAVNFIVD
jgi:DNA polymerase-3 subunit alpha